MRLLKESGAAVKAAKISNEQQKQDSESIVAMAGETIQRAMSGEISGAVTMLISRDFDLVETLYAGNVKRNTYAIGFAAQKLARQMAWT